MRRLRALARAADDADKEHTPVTYHFQVEGPGRIYDFCTFCKRHECYEAALEFANEWMAEQVDCAEIDDKIEVSIAMLPDDPLYCYECKAGEEP